MFVALAAILCDAAQIDKLHAKEPCDSKRPPAERSHDCIEFADRRFRIPAGHFVPWHYVDMTDPSQRIRFQYPSGKTGRGYFLFSAVLPDLSVVRELQDSRRIADVDLDTFKNMGGAKTQSGALAVVQRRENSRVGVRIELHAGEWVFAGRLVGTLYANGCLELEATTPGSIVIRCPRADTYHLYRNGAGISHFLIDAPGVEGYACQVPLSQGIYLSVSVTDDQRQHVCDVAIRMRDKLRSFAY